MIVKRGLFGKVIKSKKCVIVRSRNWASWCMMGLVPCYYENSISARLLAFVVWCASLIYSTRRLKLPVRTIGVTEATDLILSYSFSHVCSLIIDKTVGDERFKMFTEPTWSEASSFDFSIIEHNSCTVIIACILIGLLSLSLVWLVSTCYYYQVISGD